MYFVIFFTIKSNRMEIMYMKNKCEIDKYQNLYKLYYGHSASDNSIEKQGNKVKNQGYLRT